MTRKFPMTTQVAKIQMINKMANNKMTNKEEASSKTTKMITKASPQMTITNNFKKKTKIHRTPRMTPRKLYLSQKFENSTNSISQSTHWTQNAPNSLQLFSKTTTKWKKRLQITSRKSASESKNAKLIQNSSMTTCQISVSRDSPSSNTQEATLFSCQTAWVINLTFLAWHRTSCSWDS